MSTRRRSSLSATGASLVVSTPPATPASICPSAIFCATASAAWSPVSHACWTSCAGVAWSSDEPSTHSRDDVAEALALEAEARDEAVERRREHVLVGGLGVSAARACEGDPVAAEDRGTAWKGGFWHVSILQTSAFICAGTRVPCGACQTATSS